MGLFEKYFNSDLKDNPFFSELLSSCIEYSAKYGHCGFLLTDVVRSRKCGSHKLPFNFGDIFWGLN